MASFFRRMNMSAEQVLEQVALSVSACRKCDLHYSRKKAVPGEGPVNSEIMLIGEGPGFYENEQGRPFVGAAGKFLEELLAGIGMKREDVFITNIVKCRPPNNRDPRPEEIEACAGDYLEQQIQAINPKVIVTLGRFSMARFLPDVKISSVHGRPMWVSGRLYVPMFHPAAALHQPSLRPSLIADFAGLPELIAKAGLSPNAVNGSKEVSNEKPAPDPKQLTFF
jgi:uracil-DNA glycosylase